MKMTKEKKRVISILYGKLETINHSTVKSAVSDVVNFSSRVMGETPKITNNSNVLWTRGDGSTYRELDSLLFRTKKEVVWEHICKIEGVKKGFVRGEFHDSEPMQAIRIGKVFFCVGKYTIYHIYYGSVSRLNKKWSDIHAWVNKSWD
jgi:hypothetical protein